MSKFPLKNGATIDHFVTFTCEYKGKQLDFHEVFNKRKVKGLTYKTALRRFYDKGWTLRQTMRTPEGRNKPIKLKVKEHKDART